MIKIDIFSGFLGAGKTTLIIKLLADGYNGEKIVLIENEFGEIGIDGGFLQDAGITINEMNSGCICCSLVGDFTKALAKVIAEYSPDRIIIEPSGVGKLSDVIKAVERVVTSEVALNSFTTVADVNKCKMYLKNFGEFYIDQIENASAIILSHTQSASEKKVAECVEILREHNDKATVVTTPWDELSGAQLLEAIEGKSTLASYLAKLLEESGDDDEDEDVHEHHHHHHDDDDDDENEHEHHHHDDHDEDEDGHEHHHHHHDDDDVDEECHCHHDGEEGHHHHHHHADEVFESWGIETSAKFSVTRIKEILSCLDNSEKFGLILRSKGIVAGEDGKWIHFDFIPEESNVRYGSSSVIGRICVIGSKINKEEIERLFGVKA